MRRNDLEPRSFGIRSLDGDISNGDIWVRVDHIVFAGRSEIKVKRDVGCDVVAGSIGNDFGIGNVDESSVLRSETIQRLAGSKAVTEDARQVSERSHVIDEAAILIVAFVMCSIHRNPPLIDKRSGANYIVSCERHRCKRNLPHPLIIER